MTYRKIVYMILDEVKLISDDSIINEDHIVFLLDTYRPFILKQYYDKQKEQEIPDQNYQEICLDLEEVAAASGGPCEDTYLRSTEKLPKLSGLGSVTVSPADYYGGIYITYVTKNRMRFVGHNKWLKNFSYCSLGPDEHLYLNSSNPQFAYLDKLKVTAIFDDAQEAAKYACCPDDSPTGGCDPLDNDFPLEDHLIPQVMELVLKQVLGAAYRPSDDTNNAKDDLADLNTYIARNVKSNLAKQISE